MEQRGFIRGMMDVKVLILFVATESEYPMTLQQIYEMCFQDDRLSYFDVSIAVPEMVGTGHLQEVEHGKYRITDFGREAEAATRDEIAAPVRDRARAAVAKFNQKMHRERMVHCTLRTDENGEITVVMDLGDDIGQLMHLELTAPNEERAQALRETFEMRAERIYRDITDLFARRGNAQL